MKTFKFTDKPETKGNNNQCSSTNYVGDCIIWSTTNIINFVVWFAENVVDSIDLSDPEPGDIELYDVPKVETEREESDFPEPSTRPWIKK